MTKNILIVTISNVIRLVAGMVVGFVIPKFLSKADFGCYKTYTLYMTYIGLFSLGLIDGIYLKYGGKDYQELDKGKFRFYIRVLFYIQLIMSIVGFVVAFFFLKGELRIIFISIALNLIAQQLLTYFAQVSQLTSQFNILSIFNIIWSAITILGVGLIYLIPNANYSTYIIIVVGTNYVLLLYYFIKYHDIVFGKAVKWKDEKNEIWDLMKLGLPLLIANLVSTLILSCDRIFIERMYDIEQFSTYSFAYSLFSIANTFITAVSMVLYPVLKKMEDNNVKRAYHKANSLLLIIVFAGISMYFPLNSFIRWYLDKYTDSLIIFRIILPGLAVSSCISVVMQNYYKVTNRNLSFFIISILVLVIAVITNLVAIFVFEKPMYLSIASVITLFIWYFISEIYFLKGIPIGTVKNGVFLLLSTAVFYSVSILNINWLGFLIYVVGEGVLIILFYYKLLFALLGNIIHKKDLKEDGERME